MQKVRSGHIKNKYIFVPYFGKKEHVTQSISLIFCYDVVDETMYDGSSIAL
jgi:hypothetical protein